MVTKLVIAIQAIYVRNDFNVNVKVLKGVQNSDKIFEHICVEVWLSNFKFTVICLYTSPDGDPDECMSRLETVMHNFENYEGPLVCRGEFNFDFKEKRGHCEEVGNILNSFGVRQSIFEYTRVQGNSKSIIDI